MFVHRLKFPFCLIAMSSIGSLNAGPLVTKVVTKVDSETNTVTISYELNHSEGLASTVTAEATNNNEYWLLLNEVSADVGAGITAGPEKQIVWQAGSEWPPELLTTVKIRVRACDEQAAIPASPPPGFSLIPAETFTMGSPGGELGRLNNEILHRVTLTRSFYLAKTELSWTDWNVVRDWAFQNGYDDLPTGRNGSAGDERERQPVTRVSWYGTLKWLNAKSEMDGMIPCYTINGNIYRTGLNIPNCNFDVDGYRLPTEAEWEHACRAGTLDAYYTGAITFPENAPLDPNLDLAGWYESNSGFMSRAIGDSQKQANDFDLRDMHGNVLEWCWDAYTAYPVKEIIDPIGAAVGTDRVARGGSWSHEARACRSAARLKDVPGSQLSWLGFRVARTVAADLETDRIGGLSSTY